ncbi:uncharacterized protein F4812DRAFT_469246 [Daldinia caldariorum]|uniref:uncharacterized protein n=1 Tax=Daldinia caldariorum TaxID=326644 RepID=UPI002007F368|nr:uncharacterized protein F4812DRAFT_469246 [Daldinia caldariorum]KAI1470692.1 hypothetical protein F4812DRAFT_469246 [Daldinia caldariorum]
MSGGKGGKAWTPQENLNLLMQVVDPETPRRGSRQRTQKRSYFEWASDDEEDKVSAKRSCLSSDEDEKVEDSEDDNAVIIAKKKPVRSAKRSKKGVPEVKLEDPADSDDGVEVDASEA